MTSRLVTGEVRDQSFISSRAGCRGKQLSLRLNFHGSILKCTKFETHAGLVFYVKVVKL